MCKINIRKVIKKQLEEQGLTNILFNMEDTITNDLYYSNSESRKNNLKFGRHFEGLYFNDKKCKK